MKETCALAPFGRPHLAVSIILTFLAAPRRHIRRDLPSLLAYTNTAISADPSPFTHELSPAVPYSWPLGSHKAVGPLCSGSARWMVCGSRHQLQLESDRSGPRESVFLQHSLSRGLQILQAWLSFRQPASRSISPLKPMQRQAAIYSQLTPSSIVDP